MNIQDAIRYANGDPKDVALLQEIEQTYIRLMEVCPFRIEYRILDKTSPNSFAPFSFQSKMALDLLCSSEKLVVLLCTLGHPFEQELNRYSLLDPKKALLWDACGSAYIEECLDAFEQQLKAQLAPFYLTDRFSCGYGDLPLTMQSQIVSFLEGTKRLGVFVSKSQMLFPTKSVSAFLGVSPQKQPAKIKGCSYCMLNTTCPYRKKGKSCHETNR